METPETPEFTRTVELLKKVDLKSREAVELAERIGNMASQNIIAQYGSELRALRESLDAKMDAQNSKIDAQNALIAAQTSKYNVLIWMIGFATAVISGIILFVTSGG